jgi:hypothetical protein
MIGFIALFFDGDYLSSHGNRVLYPDFQRVLKKYGAVVE